MPRPGPSSSASTGRRRDHTLGSQVESDDDDEQSDSSGPRVAQWVDEEDLEDLSSLEEEEGGGSSDLETSLKRDLSELPLGALIKAQKMVKNAGSQDSDDAYSSNESESDVTESVGGSAEKSKNKKAIEHRSNKHAPMEVTSKKPVPRRRQVVEVHSVRHRDPRFSDLSGALSLDRFHSQYGFLSDLHVDELSTLKQSLARARKLLTSSPRESREVREKEVKRLELAVKRAESAVNREKREEVERHALKKMQRDEKDKRRGGKKAWWLKEADKKTVRLRARMDALAAEGGKQAVRKAIAKRQKKIGQKEKKSRPFAPGSERKRKREEAEAAGRHGKRRRTDKS